MKFHAVVELNGKTATGIPVPDQIVTGLAGGKRVVLAISRGGIYSPGSPHAGVEHADSYLRGLFGFLGVERIETVLAEGIALGAEQRQAALAAGRDAAAARS